MGEGGWRNRATFCRFSVRMSNSGMQKGVQVKRVPQQNFACPSVKDSRQQTATSPGLGHLWSGVLDSWASSCLLCPVLCWIGLSRVLMTSSMMTLARNDVMKRHRIVPSDDGVMMSQWHHHVQMTSLMTSIYDVINDVIRTI